MSKIPKVFSKNWTGLTANVTRKKMFEYYSWNYQGKTVFNKHRGIEIQFIREGGEKVSYGGKIYPKKACLIEVLDILIVNAIYSNWGDRKSQDRKEVIGYLNFKSLAIIDEKKEFIHLVVQLRNDGKFYYTHEVNIIKKGT